MRLKTISSNPLIPTPLKSVANGDKRRKTSGQGSGVIETVTTVFATGGRRPYKPRLTGITCVRGFVPFRLDPTAGIGSVAADRDYAAVAALGGGSIARRSPGSVWLACQYSRPTTWPVL